MGGEGETNNGEDEADGVDSEEDERVGEVAGDAVVAVLAWEGGAGQEGWREEEAAAETEAGGAEQAIADPGAGEDGEEAVGEVREPGLHAEVDRAGEGRREEGQDEGGGEAVEEGGVERLPDEADELGGCGEQVREWIGCCDVVVEEEEQVRDGHDDGGGVQVQQGHTGGDQGEEEGQEHYDDNGQLKQYLFMIYYLY